MSLLFGRRRIPARQPINPMDKCTIFSIYPKEIDELKPTIQPGRFVIPAGSPEKPQRLVVTSSSWWKETGVDEPYIEIVNSSIQVANSVVNDYCNGLVGCNMGDSMPGLFYLTGVITDEQLISDYKDTLNKAIIKQNKYWNQLIVLTDILWANTNGNPLCVADDARMACKQLGIENKDWMQNFQNQNSVRCAACGSLRNPAFPVCGSCNRIVDLALATKLGIIDPPPASPIKIPVVSKPVQ